MRGEGGGGGWQNAMGTVGGLTRTYGLQNHFTEREPGAKVAVGSIQFRRILPFFRPYLRSWLAVLACIAVGSGLAVLPPFCVQRILDHALPQRDSGLLALLAGAMVGLALASSLIGVAQQTLTVKAGQGLLCDLRQRLFVHLQGLGLGFFASQRTGEVVSRISSDVNAVGGVASGTLPAIASNLAGLVVTATALLSLHPGLTLLAVLVVPAFYLPSRLVGAVRRRLSARTQESQAAMQGFLTERLTASGRLLGDLCGQRSADAGRFAERSREVQALHVRQAVVGRWLFAVLSVFSAAGPALVYWYGGNLVMHAELTPGLLVAFAALLTLLYRPMVQLATVWADIQGAMGVFDRIFAYLDLAPAVRERPDPLRLERVRGEVVFDGVGFRYPPRGGEGAPVADFGLHDVSFRIAPGERVALVGPSGAGKSTLTALLPRCYDPAEGRITLDGHDLRDLAIEDLRRHIGMVTQETFLLHESVRANLLYAAPQATEAQIEAACRAARIHEPILALEQGYDTVVGERGFRLSGGEKQRLAIARALLRDPAILVLDEATSSLDAENEHLVQEALDRLLAGRTALVIAHRLSTILSADRIVVLEAGRVVQQGPHAALLAEGGLYAELFKRQFAAVLAEG